jgi:hypothetical protein
LRDQVVRGVTGALGDAAVIRVGTVMNFAEAEQAHALVESGQLPRTADGMVGRIVLRP